MIFNFIFSKKSIYTNILKFRSQLVSQLKFIVLDNNINLFYTKWRGEVKI